MLPVGVVGGGPTGLVASILLSQLGIPHVLFERYPSTSIHPKAVGLNQRTIEIFRQLGVERHVLREAAPPEISGRTGWYTSFGPAGREIFSRDAWGGGSYREEYEDISPCRYVLLPQIRLEPILKKRALALNPGGIHYQAEVVGVEEKPDRVILRVKRPNESSLEQVQVSYCIGADGGRAITEELGVGWEGESNIVDMVTAHVRAPISNHHPDIRNFITWFINPKLGGTIGSGYLYHLGPYPMHPATEEWCFACARSPQDPKQFDESAMLSRMHNTLQIPDLPVQVLSISHWNVNALCAKRYRSRLCSGRVFLVGDAAHRIPPWGALGLNTGVQDVHNLVWKLNFALTTDQIPQWLSPGLDVGRLLDSYDRERRPIGTRVRDTSLHNLRAHALVMDKAIGISPDNSEADNVAAMDLLLLATDDDDIRTDPPRSGAAERRAAVIAAQRILDQEFHAVGAEVGWFYPSTPATTFDPDDDGQDQLNILHYRPSTLPGHHLPHVWVKGQAEERKSTRDLVRYDGFVLLTASPDLWEEAVRRDVAGEEDHLRRPWVSLVAIIDPSDEDGKQREDVWCDNTGSWRKICGVEGTGAILVRPDGIVAGRVKEFPRDQNGGRDILKNMIRRALSLDETVNGEIEIEK